MFIGLRTVVGSTMSNTWLFRFILVCATALRIYIWYDEQIHLFVQIPVLEVHTY